MHGLHFLNVNYWNKSTALGLSNALMAPVYASTFRLDARLMMERWRSLFLWAGVSSGREAALSTQTKPNINYTQISTKYTRVLIWVSLSVLTRHIVFFFFKWGCRHAEDGGCLFSHRSVWKDSACSHCGSWSPVPQVTALSLWDSSSDSSSKASVKVNVLPVAVTRKRMEQLSRLFFFSQAVGWCSALN